MCYTIHFNMTDKIKMRKKMLWATTLTSNDKQTKQIFIKQQPQQKEEEEEPKQSKAKKKILFEMKNQHKTQSIKSIQCIIFEYCWLVGWLLAIV